MYVISAYTYTVILFMHTRTCILVIIHDCSSYCLWWVITKFLHISLFIILSLHTIPLCVVLPVFVANLNNRINNTKLVFTTNIHKFCLSGFITLAFPTHVSSS